MGLKSRRLGHREPKITKRTRTSALMTGTWAEKTGSFWRHNQSVYTRRYSQWERSFIRQLCGTLHLPGIGFPKGRACIVQG